MAATNSDTELLLAAKNKVLTLNKAAYIAGFSTATIATVNNQTIITPMVEGTVQSTECGLCEMDEPPDEKQMKEFSKSRYIFIKDQFFYYNKSKNTITPIDLKADQLNDLHHYFANKQVFKAILTNNPDEFKKNQGFRNAILLDNDVLYYKDSATQSYFMMMPTQRNQDQYNQLKATIPLEYANTAPEPIANDKEDGLIKSLTGQKPIDILSEEQLEQITAITGHTHSSPAALVTQDSVFGVASLSKPVFAYLVLKLIEANNEDIAAEGTGKFRLPEGLTHFDLDTPLSTILPLENFTIAGLPKSDLSAVPGANELTARMVLSHQTGLASLQIDFQFDPGKGHGYSNVGICYLQQAIEKLTESNLETLAQTHVFKPLLMVNSTYLSDKNNPLDAWAVYSLHTTASEYAILFNSWMHEKDCSLIKMSEDPTRENQREATTSRYILTDTGLFYYNKSNKTVNAISLDETGSKLAELHSRFAAITADKPSELLSDETLAQISSLTGHKSLLPQAFVPQVFMTEDKGMAGTVGVARGTIPDADLNHVAWGIGLGLQTDEHGKVTSAYHSGDMNEWRAWIAMNLEDKSATVYFANSPNGHILAEQIIPKSTKLEHAMNYFYQKWGFARTLEELGGMTDNWGISAANSQSPILVPVTQTLDIIPPASQNARETTLRFKQDINASRSDQSAEEAPAEYRNPTPLQTTCKPKLPGE